MNSHHIPIEHLLKLTYAIERSFERSLRYATLTTMLSPCQASSHPHLAVLVLLAPRAEESCKVIASMQSPSSLPVHGQFTVVYRGVVEPMSGRHGVTLSGKPPLASLPKSNAYCLAPIRPNSDRKPYNSIPIKG